MKKIALMTFAILLLFGPMLLIAAPDVYATATPTPIRTDTPPLITVEGAITTIFNTGFWLLIAVSGLFFLYGAYMFLIEGAGGGTADKVTKGKNILLYGAIALVIAILARGLAAFIPRMFGIT